MPVVEFSLALVEKALRLDQVYRLCLIIFRTVPALYGDRRVGAIRSFAGRPAEGRGCPEPRIPLFRP